MNVENCMIWTSGNKWMYDLNKLSIHFIDIILSMAG